MVSGRLNTGQGFLSGRSRCDACDRPLAVFSLLPVVSYIVYRGRARCCGSKISFYSPITELLLGVLFVLAYLKLELTAPLFFFLVSLSALLALVLYDLAHKILPWPLLAIFVISSTVAGFLTSSILYDFYLHIVIAFFISGSLALIHFLSRGRAMGFADVPLSFGLAVLVGPAALSGFIFSFWIGAVIGIILLYKRRSGSRMGIEVPFAPFLAAGFLLAYFTQWNPLTLISQFLNIN